MTIRERTEAREGETLRRYAQLARDSAGRGREEEPDPVRTCYQRDRDRILHSKSFRRLKHKTQVFIEPKGDHYRTRLTHSLEVAQVSRTVARALGLNEDLTEAIALGHDVGHTPFGHAGEQAIDEVMRGEFEGLAGAPRGFRHFEHSLRIVDVLEDLNLTEEVRAGIGGHSKGRKDLSALDGEATSTLEAAVVRVCDRIAYLSHDLDDAVRAGLIGEVPGEFAHLGPTQGKRISAMVQDVVGFSEGRAAVGLSSGMLATMNSLKEWLFENVYLREPQPMGQVRQAKRLVRDLVLHYSADGRLPEDFVSGYGALDAGGRVQAAVDYVAGMTDRFAIATYMREFVPTEFTDLVARVR